MKNKLFFPLALFLGLILFSSCKKDHTCHCTYKDGGVSETEDFLLQNVSKKTANDACETTQTNLTFIGYDDVNCSLK